METINANATREDYLHDWVGRLTQVVQNLTGTANDQQLGFSYNPADQLASVTRINDGYAWGGHYNVDRPYGVNGLNQLTTASAVALGYDGRGNLTASGASVYGYDLDDHLSAITDEVDASRSLAFTHDAADRLSRVTLAAGATRREDYLHDANGNRTAVERRTLPTDATPTSTDTYSRTSGTNRIASISTASGTRTFTHDARGNLAGEARPGGVSVTAGYDGFGRLTSYVQSGQPALAMTYNGHDERVTLTRGTAAVRRFIHDPDGRVIGEYTSGPTTPIAEYIWLLPETDDGSEAGGGVYVPSPSASASGDGLGGWHPLAVVTADGAGGSPTLLWLHGNHLGVPQLATNAADTSVAMTGFPGHVLSLPALGPLLPLVAAAQVAFNCLDRAAAEEQHVDHARLLSGQGCLERADKGE